MEANTLILTVSGLLAFIGNPWRWFRRRRIRRAAIKRLMEG